MAGFSPARIAREQGDAQTGFVHKSLIVPAVLAEKVAVVGGVDDQGVFAQICRVQIVEYPAQVFVDPGDCAVAVHRIALVDPVPVLLGV